MEPRLTDSWQLGPLTVPNRVMLAPLAGIGNWFVRLQAKRYGAGMAVSEMVSSHAIHHRNARTCEEMLRIHPQERDVGAGGVGGLVSIQLFGADPQVMRSAAATAAAAGADAIDLNMGCPVPKVCKTGAGAALLDDPDLAVAVARAAAQGSGLPVTVKLRSGRRPGETSGLQLAKRLVAEAGVAAIALHPRSAAVHHKGRPDYELAARLVCELGAPMILTGGLRDRDSVLAAFRQTGASAVMLARGALGNPWLFSQLLRQPAGRLTSAGAPTTAVEGSSRDAASGRTWAAEGPTRAQAVAELRWTIDRAVEHFGRQRATRWMRKAYPWYVAQLRLARPAGKELQQALQRAPTLAEVDALLDAALADEAAQIAALCPA
jgi:nifR3 family TIM-barrel protein